MSVTNSYRAEGRSRIMTSENNFSSGMRYSDNPLTEGYVKMLVNYQLGNDGGTLKPRPGYKCVQENISTALINPERDHCVHHTTQTYVNYADEKDAVTCRYCLFGNLYDTSETEQKLGLPDVLFDLSSATVTLLANGTYLSASNDSSKYTAKGTDDHWYLTMQPTPDSIHGVPLGVTHSRTGIYTVMDNNTYVCVYHTYKDGVILRIEKYIGIIHMTFNASMTTFTWYVKQLQPNNITATQAVNYGYNMLLDEPYKFENKSTSNVIPQLDGIIPYNAKGELMTSARVGAELYFHLIYRYPEKDKTDGKKYYVQWEIKDLDSDADAKVVQQVRKSQAYTPGADIFFVANGTTYKRFTLIAKLYYKDVVDNTKYDNTNVSIEVNDSLHLEPIATITLAYYYLTSDNSTTTLNVDAVQYDLKTATGMCTWQQRIVLWGVKNAKNTLWVSEINDPSWFPYPNNCEIFDTDIVACVKYKTSLLVFTKTSLYQLTFSDDGLSYTTKCIQERLTMEPEDASSIISVQSMVFFKNGNYYYLVVPVTTSTTGELQLAPITRPIEYFLDNFNDSMQALLDTLIQPKANKLETSYSLYDWWCQLEQKTMRIYYKMKVVLGTHFTFMDIVFNYDTQLRVWTVYAYNSTAFRMTPYIPSVTAETVFVMPQRQSEHSVTLNLIQADVTNPEDTFPLDYLAERSFKLVQYVDTGYRAIELDYKKRFRQIQFRVTNPYCQHLNFYTMFTVDNDLRKPLYTYETTTITDPSADDYGTVYVDSTLEDAEEVPSLSEKQDELNEWGIDLTRFPDLTTAQVKLNVSGKGRLPRLMIRSENQTMFEITNMLWVYRLMMGR